LSSNVVAIRRRPQTPQNVLRTNGNLASPLHQCGVALTAPLPPILVGNPKRFEALGPSASRTSSEIVNSYQTFVNQSGVDQPMHDGRLDKVEIFLAACDQLRRTEIVRIETPPHRSCRWIHEWNKSVLPSIGKHRRSDTNTLSVHAERLVKMRTLTDSAVDLVRVVITAEREQIRLDRDREFIRQRDLGIRSQNRLRSNHHDGCIVEDARRCPDDVAQLSSSRLTDHLKSLSLIEHHRHRRGLTKIPSELTLV
jgi:hypothetical protein